MARAWPQVELPEQVGAWRSLKGLCSAGATGGRDRYLVSAAATVHEVARHVRLRELLVGIEGLALLRHLFDGADEDADRRLAEVRRLLEEESFSAGELTSEAEPRLGYSSWSHRYDEPGNPIVALEEPVVWSLLETFPPGRALDAACGTGRHARQLVALGHQVIGVDLTPAMLSRAARNVPGAAFLEADLRAIPIADAQFDVVVSGLALAHIDELTAALAELARVLRPGGRVVVSVLHPFQAHLGWHAPFQDERGQRRFVREHGHSHSDYLASFRSAGLRVLGCVEPELTAGEVRAKRRAFRSIPEAAMAAYLGLPGVLVWDAEKPDC
jgi:SAM-dependent methyltransferase